jgi:hypothetical protein
LKSKLPFGKKDAEQDEEFEEIEEGTSPEHENDATGATDIADYDLEEEEENKSLVDKIKSKVQGLLNKNKNSDDESDEEADDEEAKKKKLKSNIIRGVIVLAVVGFLAEEYIFPPEEPMVEPQLKPRPRPTKPVQPVEPTEEAPADQTPPVEAPTEEAPADQTPPVEAPTEEAPADEVPTEAAVEEAPVIETPSEDSPNISGDESPVDITVTETPSEDSSMGDISFDSDDSPLIDTASDTADTIDGISTGSNDDNLTDQILQDLEKQAKGSDTTEPKKEYVAPPDYEYTGRGLVYNCTGKHWACVDGPSYKTCEDNASSVKYLNKKTECYPFNVYETVRGCEDMQNRMVSSSAKTDFCAD